MPSIVIIIELVMRIGMIVFQIPVKSPVVAARHPILVRAPMVLLEITMNIVVLILDLIVFAVMLGIATVIRLAIIASAARPDGYRPAALCISSTRHQSRSCS